MTRGWRQHHWKRWLLLAGLLLIGIPGSSGTPFRPLSQYFHEAWTSEHGLPQNSVNAVTHSQDGYLWLGTWEGLVRFDGVRFFPVDTSILSGQKNNSFISLLRGRGDLLWAGTGQGDLICLRNGIPWKRWELPKGSITALHEDAKGVLWVGTEGHGLFRLRMDDQWQLERLPAFASQFVKAIAESREGTIWIATTDQGLWTHGQGGFVKAGGLDLDSIQVNALAFDKTGGLWIGTSAGLYHRSQAGRFVRYARREGLASDMVLSLCLDGQGGVWIGTDAGIGRLLGGRISTMKESDGLTHNHVTALFEDQEGSLWAGTTVGLNRLRAAEVVSYGVREGMLHDVVESVFQDRAGDLWLGHSVGSASRLSGGRPAVGMPKGRLPDSRVRAIGQASDGSLWFGTFGSGLARYHEGKLQLFTKRDGLGSDIIRSLWGDASGRMWIGTVDGGLTLYEKGVFKTYSSRDGLPSQYVRVVRQARDGDLWIGTWGEGLCTFDGRRFTRLPLGGGSTSDMVTDVWEEESGTVWVSTNGGGLNRIRDGVCKRYSAENGLPADQIHTVIDDGLGYLWISTNKGLARIPKRSFDDFDRGAVRRLESLLFDRLDGMRNREANGGSPAGLRSRDGNIWFPTVGGAVELDPTQIHLNRREPVVRLESLLADGRPLDLRPKAHIPPGTREIQVQYTALALLIPSRVRFKYRLDGFDPSWIDAGDRRTAYYTNLSPGTYVFRVAAANENGVWNEAGDSAVFQVLPRFYQTYWFRILGTLVVALALGGTVWILVRRAERIQADRLVRENDQRFRALVENSADGIVLMDSGGKIMYVSPSVEKILGYESQELSGHLFGQIIHPEERSHWKSLEDRARANHGQLHPIITRFLHKDGTWRFIESSLVNRFDDPSVGGMVLNFRDITERKHMEFQLLQSQKLESIGQLAAGIAHELNTPIQFVGDNLRFLREAFKDVTQLIECSERAVADQNLGTGMAESIEKLDAALRETDPDYLKAEIPSALSQSLDGIERVATIVRAMKAFSHPDGGEEVPSDLNAALESTVTVARSEWKYVADVKLELDPDLPLVPCRLGELNQAFLNILVNAAHAIAGRTKRDGSPKGLITIQTQRLDGWAEIRITDTGTGIPEEIRSRVFDPFFTTKPVGMGTGQGLNLVHAIITKHHGGSLDFTTQMSSGTTFIIRLPFHVTPGPDSTPRA